MKKKNIINLINEDNYMNININESMKVENLIHLIVGFELYTYDDLFILLTFPDYDMFNNFDLCLHENFLSPVISNKDSSNIDNIYEIIKKIYNIRKQKKLYFFDNDENKYTINISKKKKLLEYEIINKKYKITNNINTILNILDINNIKTFNFDYYCLTCYELNDYMNIDDIKDEIDNYILIYNYLFNNQLPYINIYKLMYYFNNNINYYIITENRSTLTLKNIFNDNFDNTIFKKMYYNDKFFINIIFQIFLTYFLLKKYKINLSFKNIYLEKIKNYINMKYRLNDKLYIIKLKTNYIVKINLININNNFNLYNFLQHVKKKIQKYKFNIIIDNIISNLLDLYNIIDEDIDNINEIININNYLLIIDSF